MTQKDESTSVFQSNIGSNSKNPYPFMAASYDISSLAKNIMATKTASSNILHLKKYGNMSV